MSTASEPQIIHPVSVDDVEPWLTQVITTLLGDPYDGTFARRAQRWSSDWVAERTWAVRDRGRVVGTLATEERLLTIPAADGATAELAMDALTAVSVAATHRRRGLLTRMISGSLAAAKERGDALSGLIAAEWPIYGRFGYAPATQFADLVYRSRNRGALIEAAPGGFVRHVEPDELFPAAMAVFDRARRLRVGQLDRPELWWRFALGVGVEPPRERHHWVLHESVDGPSGLLGWRPTRDFDIDGKYAAVRVESLVAADELAYRNLWAYLSGLDAVEEIELGNRSVDEPARWLLGDGRALRQTYTGDFLWLRILDLPAALAARGYAAPGRVVIEVIDDAAAPYASGRVRLDATTQGAQCSPTTETADVTLSARALGSAYLGGNALQGRALAGDVEEHRRGALRLLDSMLSVGLAPWCQTAF